MKLLINILFLTAFIISHAQYTYVPDDNFEQALIDLGYDDVLDDYVLTVNINNIEYLAINENNIVSIEGIEDFSALEYLNCEQNLLNSFDLSYNLALEYLFCSVNNLDEINIEMNSNLKVLFCAGNPILYLDLSSNYLIEEVDCNGTNVQYIDIRNDNNELISTFYAINNPSLNCIYVDDSNASFLSNWWIDTNTHFVETEQDCIDLGVLSFKKHKFVLYPNPVNEVITFTHNNLINYISVFNVQGKLLKEFTKQDSYNVNNLKNGIYYIKTSTKNHTEFMKFIKK